jgi:flavin reductase (DIM6/NTAB) family NADH-FMN oxidoreductase RutF
MNEVAEKIHRLLAPRLIAMIGTVSENGRKNIIPINNITSISTDPGMVLIAVHHPWITADNLKSARGFTISVPSEEQLELVWKLAPKYSGYESEIDKIEEFKTYLDTEFSEFGPVLKNALCWIECEVAGRPNEAGGNHILVIGKYNKAAADGRYFDADLNPVDNPKPVMQWAGNRFSSASDIVQIPYYGDKSR